MNQPEVLKSNENRVSAAPKGSAAAGSLTKLEVGEIYNFRQNCLKNLRSAVSLKFYHQISEKLDREQRLFEQLLNWQDAKQDVLARYSFVLNPNYFEQKFFRQEA